MPGRPWLLLRVVTRSVIAVCRTCLHPIGAELTFSSTLGASSTKRADGVQEPHPLNPTADAADAERRPVYARVSDVRDSGRLDRLNLLESGLGVAQVVEQPRAAFENPVDDRRRGSRPAERVGSQAYGAATTRWTLLATSQSPRREETSRRVATASP